MRMTRIAWESVTTETIQNCFRKAGFSTDAERSESAQSDRSDYSLEYGDPNGYPAQLTATDFDNYVDIDQDIPTEGFDFESPISSTSAGQENSDSEEEVSRTVNRSEALQAWETVALYMMEHADKAELAETLKFEACLQKVGFKNLKQHQITDFFAPKE